MRWRCGEALYEITVQNPEHREQGVAWVEMDGQQMHDGVIPLFRDAVRHHVTVQMGEPQK